MTKTDFAVKLLSFNRKITENKTKHLLVQNELNKLKTFDLSYFICKSQFEEDGAFQPIKRYFKIIANSKLFHRGNLKDYLTKLLSLQLHLVISLLDYYGSKLRVKFNKGCLKQPNKLTYDYGRKVNIYIVYELGASTSNDSNPTLKNYLFGAVTLIKKADIEKYGYSGYGIGFDRISSFSFPGG